MKNHSQRPLHYNFKQNNQVALSFKTELNFTGWRGIAVPFRDMKGSATGKLDKLVITAKFRSSRYAFFLIK